MCPCALGRPVLGCCFGGHAFHPRVFESASAGLRREQQAQGEVFLRPAPIRHAQAHRRRQQADRAEGRHTPGHISQATLPAERARPLPLGAKLSREEALARDGQGDHAPSEVARGWTLRRLIDDGPPIWREVGIGRAEDRVQRIRRQVGVIESICTSGIG